MDTTDTVINTENTPRCNTNIKRGAVRCRNWCFTLNNYTAEDIKKFCSDDYNYVFQEETGKNGTKHLQGILMYNNARTFTHMKKLNNKCHWEPCKNKTASIRYCSKKDTRTGQIFTNIKLNTTDTDTTENLIKKLIPFDELLKQDLAKSWIEYIKTDEWLNWINDNSIRF
jgi:hypothetical protein